MPAGVDSFVILLRRESFRLVWRNFDFGHFSGVTVAFGQVMARFFRLLDFRDAATKKSI
jgi:hypothetical protein